MLSVADGVSEAEVARAKAQLKASLVMNLESASSRADQIARQFLAFGHVPSIATLVAKIEAVTREQVRALARRPVQGQDARLQRRRPISEFADYEPIVRTFRLSEAMSFLRSPFRARSSARPAGPPGLPAHARDE